MVSCTLSETPLSLVDFLTHAAKSNDINEAPYYVYLYNSMGGAVVLADFVVSFRIFRCSSALGMWRNGPVLAPAAARWGGTPSWLQAVCIPCVCDVCVLPRPQCG